MRVWVHKNVSQILAAIEFSSGEIARKTLPVGKGFTGDINSGHSYKTWTNLATATTFLTADRHHWHVNFRPTGLGLGPILRVAHNSELTRFKLIIDLDWNVSILCTIYLEPGWE